MMPGQVPRKMTMKCKTVFAHDQKSAEEAINSAIINLELEGYMIQQVLNITHNEAPLDDDWKVLIFAAKEQEVIIEKPQLVVDPSGRKMN